MKDKAIIAALLLCIGGISGWQLRLPPDPEVQTVIEYRELAAKADTIYLRDTVRYQTWRTVYDTVRERLDVTDTVEVIRYVHIADSTVTACSLALLSCNKALDWRDSVIRAQASWIERNKPRRRSAWLVWGERIGTITLWEVARNQVR